MSELLFAVVLFVLVNLIGGLFFWGIGNFVIVVFGINYTWTFWHGVVISILQGCLKATFTRGK